MEFRFLGVLTLLAATALAGCAGGSSEDKPTIEASNFAFMPPTLTIQAGESVQFRNSDGVVHTATSAGNFDTGDIAANGKASQKFETPGTYQFRCKYHPSMTGSIIVE